MSEMTLTDAWVSTLLTNVIAQIVSSLNDCEIDPAKDVGILHLEFDHDIKVTLTIKFGEIWNITEK